MPDLKVLVGEGAAVDGAPAGAVARREVAALQAGAAAVGATRDKPCGAGLLPGVKPPHLAGSLAAQHGTNQAGPGAGRVREWYAEDAQRRCRRDLEQSDAWGPGQHGAAAADG